MLRTTISKIRKVCTVTFAPRILRGDQRYTPGKFEKFSYAVLRKAQKSTKSTDNEQCIKKESDNEGSGKSDGFLFVSEEPKTKKDKIISNIEPGLEGDKIEEKVEEKVGFSLPIRETNYKKCQRLIDRAFGKEDSADAFSGEQYCSHNVNLQETRREISEAEKAKVNFADGSSVDKPTADDRIRMGVYDNRTILEDKPDLLLNESLTTATDKKAGTHDINITEPVEELGRIELNILLTDGYQSRDLTEGSEQNAAGRFKVIGSDDQIEAETLPFKEPEAKANVDKNVHNKESKENEVLLKVDTNADYLLKADPASKRTVDDVEKCYKLNLNRYGETKVFQPNIAKEDKEKLTRKIEHLQETPIVEALKPKIEGFNVTPSIVGGKILQATTAKEVDEELTQKIEHIDEPPLVEAQKPKIEGFNVNPKILGDKIVQATTAKKVEEELTNKIENIDKTPLVEAQKSKVGGFNVTPRIVGDTKAELNRFSDKISNKNETGKSPRDNVPASFDEVAKRCLETPTGKIDEILLKEMDKLGCPIAINRGSHSHSPVIENDLVQMDVLKKHEKKPIDKELDFESQEYERDTAELYSIEKLYPTRYLCNERILPDPTDSEDFKDLESVQIQTDKNKVAYDAGEYESFEKYDPSKKFSYCYESKGKPTGVDMSKISQADNFWGAEPINPIPIIDSKKLDPNVRGVNASLSYTINANVSDKIRDEQLDHETTKENVAYDIWNDEKLDPNHVLACNETCPISPRPQITGCETSRLEGTTDIYDENFMHPDLYSELDSNLINKQDSIDQNTIKIKQVSNFLKDSDYMTKGNASFMEDLGANKGVMNCDPTCIREFNISLPNLNEDVSLSELLRRVRERSRILQCKSDLQALGVEVEPVTGKCPRKAPQCLPCAPRSPPMDPIPPPPMGLPKLKRQPTPCKKRKKPCTKCSRCELDVSSGLLGPKKTVACPDKVCGMKDAETQVDVKSTRSKADLTDTVVNHLQILGKILSGMIRKEKPGAVDASYLVRNRRVSKTVLARDYEPWSPIPSWPTPKKPPPPPKPECCPGCKYFPPTRLEHDGPATQKPCEGFPRTKFSILNCIVLGKNKIYDLGEH